MTRVLVVEDDPNVALVVRLALRRAGFDVSTHSDPRAGWTWLQEQPAGSVHGVIVDLWMPFLSGTEFIARMRADGRLDRVPVVLMTGALPTRDELPPAGSYQRLLPKPFDLDAMVALVQEVTEAEPARVAAAGPAWQPVPAAP